MRATNISMKNPGNQHLNKRCQQRGVRYQEFEFLFNYADHLVPVGKGCMAMTLSRNAAMALKAEGIVIPDLDRMRSGISTGRKTVPDSAGSPSAKRASFSQLNTWFALTSYRRAT